MTWNRPWSLVWLLAWAPMPLSADSLRDAYKAFEKGQFEEAAKGFQSHTQKKPDDYDQLYNTGVALFQKGAHEEAMTYFDRAMQSPDPLLKSRAAYNKGVALGQRQKWAEAEAAFQNALSYDNDNKIIQENLQFAREQKDKQKKQDPQNQAQQDQQQNKDGKADEKQAENQPGQPQDGQQKDSADKQAQNQSSPSQNAQDQKSAQEEKTGQQSAQEQKAGQPQSAQDQKSAQEQKAGQPQGADQKSLQEQKAGQPQNGQDQKSATAGQEQEKPKQSDQMPNLVNKGEGAPDSSQAQNGQRVLTIKDLKKQEAEKLLRSVDDRIGTYILTPEQEKTEGKSVNGKDW